MATGTIVIRLYDGARKAIAGKPEVLFTIHDARERTRLSQYVRAGALRVTGLEIHDDGSDNCAVIAAMRGCSDGAFFPVPLEDGTDSEVNLMLPPRKVDFDLSGATWAELQAKRPRVFQFLAGTDADASGRAYEDLRQAAKMQLACLHNITTAIELLPDQGATGVLGFFKRITLAAIDPNDHGSTEGVKQDRFFAWAEPGLKDYLEGHPETFQLAPPGLHPGADKSYKEIRFGEANLQFTYHDKEKLPDDPRLFKVEMDMDYFKDQLAHFTLEVVPNELINRVGNLLHLGKSHLTNPAEIFALRWMAGKRNGGDEFAPPFTLQAA